MLSPEPQTTHKHGGKNALEIKGAELPVIGLHDQNEAAQDIGHLGVLGEMVDEGLFSWGFWMG